MTRVNESAERMLPFVPPFPGEDWWTIVENGPRNRRGHILPHRWSIRPLVDAGLIAINQRLPLPDGRLPTALYYITDRGRRYLARLNTEGE